MNTIMKSFQAVMPVSAVVLLIVLSSVPTSAGTPVDSTTLKAMRAQPAQPRYRIVVPGTFGGPNGHFATFGAHILNNDGTFVGWTDDTEPDPFGLLFGPDSCWDGDCFLARAFRFKDGELTDLGALAARFNSDVSWLSRGGLVSGEAQTGQLDPVSGDWTMHGTLWAHGRLIDLGTLDGGPISLTSAVNDAGEVVGFALNTIPDPFAMFGGNQTRAYRWKDGTMMDLGTLGGTNAMALRINERGQIAGNSYINSDANEFVV